MRPLYVLIRDNGDFDRTGGSSTPVRVKIYETLSKAEKQAKISGCKIVVYRPSLIRVRSTDD